MIADLKPYPAMKDCGVPWLGGVPEHWEVRRLKSVVTHVNEQTSKKNTEDLYIALEHVESWTGRLRVTRNEVEFDSQVKRFNADDILFGKLRPYLAKVVRPSNPGVCVGEFLVLRAKTASVLPAYLESALRSNHVIDAVNSSTFGAKMPRADWGFVGCMPFPVPHLHEQAAIVRFLEWADRRIRRYIRAKQKLIKLLEEQKQAIIHRAVTGQIDVRIGQPYPAYKPSGVEWLGDVPAHWFVSRLGRLIELTTGFPFKSEGFTQQDDDIRLLRGVNISPGQVRWSDVVRWPSRERRNYSAFGLQAGDIVLGMDRPIIQSGVRVAVIIESDLPSLLLQRVARIRPHRELRAEFLMLLLAGKSFSDYLTPIFTGISVPHLSPGQIKSFRCALPSIGEQEQVVEWTRANTKSIHSAVDRAQREISLLREYRTHLIADVVTGNLDIREVAAKLPDEPPEDEPKPLDEEESVGLEEDLDEEHLGAVPEEAVP